MALIIPTQIQLKPPNPLQNQILHPRVGFVTVRTKKTNCFSSDNVNHYRFKLRIGYKDSIFRTRVSDDSGAIPFQPSSSADVDARGRSSSGSSDGYVALFVRMLGLDNDPLDREQAVVALWKYSLGGKKCIDNVMQFHGAVNLTVNLLKSDSDSACEAAAGILRTISSINVYRNTVAESGAVEEITSMLRRISLSSNVKEQGLCTLWNLSVDENIRVKIANSELLPLLIKFLEDEDVQVKEAAGGVLSNLALSNSNHKIMVEAGVIPKLANLLKSNEEGYKVIRKEARNALLEFAKDDYYRILLLDEGLVLVPLIGAAAYKSFKPALYSWPSLPDGTKLEQGSTAPSRYGASELLIGLNIEDQKLDEAKKNAIVGRTQQQFLARIGAIEMEDENKSDSKSSSSWRFTLLPWVDGVARLVLILGLDDESAIARAADSIADSSVNEHIRLSFKEAGAINHLSQLLNHPNETVRLPVIRALERLSISNDVCQIIEREGVVYPLINSLMQFETSGSSTEMILNILNRILDPDKEMKSKFYDGPVNASKKGWNATRNSQSPGYLNEMAESKSTSSVQTMYVRDFVNSAFLARIIEILKTSSPNLQKKAASILEFVIVDDACVEMVISVDVASGLVCVFQQRLSDIEADTDVQRPELLALQVEEAGQAISAASRLFTRLLDSEHFRSTTDTQHFMHLLRKILISEIPICYKDWVASCLVKLSSFSGPNLDFENPVNMEVTLYETIPRLIEQIKTSSSPELQEAAVIELNRIISEGVVDSTRAVAAQGGIFPLVRLIEEGSNRAMEAGLSILYNLSMDSENHAAIISAGAVPILRRIVLSQKPQWTRALHLLRTLPT
ncbi:unnamed protein product [Coffea canephora]|uniref:Uncharacterized protein n=1 Tax=Coffea canephora TaxID=49390 RepID=A0A068TZL9_COFCA|nr:unnamed protein product [Coffea canephora]